MRHRRPEAVRADDLAEAIARAPLDHYVIWTGEACAGQAGSMRSRALACITEARSPVQLRAVLQRCAAVEAGAGFHPDAVRSAVRLHQSARPAAYLLVRKRDRQYLAVTDVPFPARGGRPICAGDVVMTAAGELLPPEFNILLAE